MHSSRLLPLVFVAALSSLGLCGCDQSSPTKAGPMVAHSPQAMPSPEAPSLNARPKRSPVSVVTKVDRRPPATAELLPSSPAKLIAAQMIQEAELRMQLESADDSKKAALAAEIAEVQKKRFQLYQSIQRSQP